MLRILIADDDAPMRRALRTLLQHYLGLQVCGEAADGVEAVSYAAGLAPDLVILDLLMPRMDGLQAGRAIHLHAPNIPLLLFTVNELDNHLIALAREAGFQGAVPKGSNELLARAVNTLLRGGLFFFGSAAGENVLVLDPAVPSDLGARIGHVTAKVIPFRPREVSPGTRQSNQSSAPPASPEFEPSSFLKSGPDLDKNSDQS